MTLKHLTNWFRGERLPRLASKAAFKEDQRHQALRLSRLFVGVTFNSRFEAQKWAGWLRREF